MLLTVVQTQVYVVAINLLNRTACNQDFLSPESNVNKNFKQICYTFWFTALTFFEQVRTWLMRPTYREVSRLVAVLHEFVAKWGRVRTNIIFPRFVNALMPLRGKTSDPIVFNVLSKWYNLGTNT